MTAAIGSAADLLWTLERLAEHLHQPGTWSSRLRDAAHAITTSFARLAAQLEADDLTLPALCEEELVFRARRWIVRSALDPLEAAIVGLQHAADAVPGRWETWCRLLPAIPLARAELDRLTQLWLVHRGGGMTLPPAALATYRTTVSAAARQLRKLDEIPDIERLLYRGVAFATHPAIARPCEQSLAAVRLDIDVQRARSFTLARGLWERTLGAARSPLGAGR